MKLIRRIAVFRRISAEKQKTGALFQKNERKNPENERKQNIYTEKYIDYNLRFFTTTLTIDQLHLLPHNGIEVKEAFSVNVNAVISITPTVISSRLCLGFSYRHARPFFVRFRRRSREGKAGCFWREKNAGIFDFEPVGFSTSKIRIFLYSITNNTFNLKEKV